MSPHAGELRERIRSAASAAALHAEDVDREARFPRESIQALKGHNLLGIMVPQRHGGPGGALADAALLCRTLGQSCGSTGLIYAMHQIQVASLVAGAGENAWQRDFLCKVAQDQLLLGSVTSEVGIGGNIRSSICAGEYEGDAVTLVKHSSAISYGAHADALLVTARRDAEAPSSDQILLVAERSGTVLTETSRWDTLGMRGTDSRAFEVRVSARRSQILDVPFGDIAQQSMLPTSHILWGSVWLGIATDAVERARAFLRHQAKNESGSLPPGALRLESAISVLSTMRARLDTALADYAAHQNSGAGALPMKLSAELNGLKIALSEMAVKAVQEAMLICGISGYRNGTPYSLGRHFRDLQSAPLMVNNDRIALNTATLLVAQRAPLMKD